ncbi:MAG: hypothetical protein IIY21_00865 [Clostridiales bacterium]|nr:hypothetical protein [Clostridiales bacterium]MBQ1571442.1 hypothetical protein [Clostridiales bacterium]
MKLYTILRNIVQGIKNAIAHSDENLQTAKDYADTKLSVADLKLGTLESTVSLSANGTAWKTVTVPSDRTLVCPAGVYWYGTYNTSITYYAYWQNGADTMQIALRNWANGSTTITVYWNYLYV